jgi:hypothetical protein
VTSPLLGRLFCLKKSHKKVGKRLGENKQESPAVKHQQLELPLFSCLKPGDVVRIQGRDQSGYRDWTGCFGVVESFPEFNCHIYVWLVGFTLAPAILMVLPFTPYQLSRTGQKHKTTWQYKDQRWREKASIKLKERKEAKESQ